MEHPFFVGAIRLPFVGKMGVINSAHVLQRCNEFGKILEMRPTLVDEINGRLHNDKMLGGVHCGRTCFHRVIKALDAEARVLLPRKRTVPSVGKVKKGHVQNEHRIMASSGAPKNPRQFGP